MHEMGRRCLFRSPRKSSGRYEVDIYHSNGDIRASRKLEQEQCVPRSHRYDYRIPIHQEETVSGGRRETRLS